MLPIEALAKLAEIATPAANSDPDEARAVHEAIVVLTRAIRRSTPEISSEVLRRYGNGDCKTED